MDISDHIHGLTGRLSIRKFCRLTFNSPLPPQSGGVSPSPWLQLWGHVALFPLCSPICFSPSLPLLQPYMSPLLSAPTGTSLPLGLPVSCSLCLEQSSAEIYTLHSLTFFKSAQTSCSTELDSCPSATTSLSPPEGSKTIQPVRQSGARQDWAGISHTLLSPLVQQ
jgi:hypothetical protein